jgi:tyrosinase
LEAIIREFSGDTEFALPYWDWTKTPRVPAAMFDDVLDPNNAAFIPTFDAFKAQFDAPVTALWATFSPAQQDVLTQRGLSSTADFWSVVAAAPAGMFFEQPAARGLTAGSPDLDRTTKATVAPATVRSALRTASFAGSESGTDAAGFASAKASSHNDQSREGILESQPHDNVHGAMGGAAGNALMVSFLSPVDPIFFLHHGNLDRLWDVWTRRQAALGHPTLPQGADLTAWSSEQFLFFSDPNGQPVSKITAGDYAAMSAFDYDYSPGSGEDQVPAPGTPVAALPATRAFSAQITSSTIGASRVRSASRDSATRTCGCRARARRRRSRRNS